MECFHTYKTKQIPGLQFIDNFNQFNVLALRNAFKCHLIRYVIISVTEGEWRIKTLFIGDGNGIVDIIRVTDR